MTSQQSHNHRSSWLLRILVPLLGSDMIELIPALLRLVRKIIRSRANEGMYEVLDLDSRLELKDVKGSKAIISFRRIRPSRSRSFGKAHQSAITSTPQSERPNKRLPNGREHRLMCEWQHFVGSSRSSVIMPIVSLN